MSTNNTPTIAERFTKLPKSTRTLLTSSAITLPIVDVLNTTKLSQADRNTCQEMMLQVMVGSITTKDFAENLEASLTIDTEKAKLLISKAEKNVFSVVRDDLMRVFEENKNASQKSENAPEDNKKLGDPYKEPVQ